MASTFAFCCISFLFGFLTASLLLANRDKYRPRNP